MSEPEQVRFVTEPLEVHGFDTQRPAGGKIGRKVLEDIAELAAQATKKFFDQAIAERDEKIKALEETVAALRPTLNRMAELEEKIAELEWELDGFRERAGAPPLRRTFERVVAASYGPDGKVLGMVKEVLEDEP